MLNNGAIIYSLKKNDEYILRPHIAQLFLYLFINLLNNISCITKMQSLFFVELTQKKTFIDPKDIIQLLLHETLKMSTMVALACTSKHNKHKQASVIYTHKQQMINSLTSHPSSHPSAWGSNSLAKSSQTSQTQQNVVATMTSFCSLSSILVWKYPQACGFGNKEG